MSGRNISNRVIVARKYLMKQPKLGAFPFEIAIGITNKCNLNCKFCPHRKSKRPVGDISIDLFDYLLEQIEPFVDAVDLSFDGEPFLHPQWVECVEACHQHNIQAILQTNSLLVDESLAREILAVGVDSITFSIDAATPEMYKRLKTGGNYEQVVLNVERFLKLARGRKKRPNALVQFVRSPENAHEAGTFLKQWRGKGADFVRIKNMLNFGGSIGFRPARKQKKPCILLWSSLAIHWDGFVPLCCMEIEGRTCMGDATKQPLAKIVDDNSFQVVRRLHALGNYEKHPICRDCDVPAVAWPFVIGSAFVGDLTRRKLINFAERFKLIKP